LVIQGQKVWTSRAEFSKWNALLVRTSQEERAGLTLVIVDMTSPGITIRPLEQLLGEPHFSEVFFDAVRVPVDNVLGGVGNGWRVAMEAMGFERGLFVLERSVRLRRRLAELGRSEAERAGDPSVQGAIGELSVRLQALQAQVYSTLAQQAAGSLPRGATSVDKLLLTDADQQLFATAFELLGEGALLDESSWAHDLLLSRSVSIYSGTSEIQHNVIASQLLGLRAAA
jgi:alkylation response protein AidB-like acyl-CoA dehydrogenase